MTFDKKLFKETIKKISKAEKGLTLEERLQVHQKLYYLDLMYLTNGQIKPGDFQKITDLYREFVNKYSPQNAKTKIATACSKIIISNKSETLQ